MNVQQAYNSWAATYDAVLNKTRDIEALAIRSVVPPGAFAEAIEIGCGTGKNTEWLASCAAHVTAVDFSAEMLSKAKAKLALPNVDFQQADITNAWAFASTPANLITCSLILEHIENLDFVFQQASEALAAGGLFYVGELHPFKQYQGSKARFDTAHGVRELECYVHHISDYMESARHHGLRCVAVQEWFDDGDRATTPRVVSFVFQKP
ncbi:class I SAM-dependent methyltransferase [Hymenobacter sp. BT491]|uniref:class I SAM-dependent methyltransferase n=1 Tax=Hymenobacter sp. BT491 TaxID=2766779 RepID=UPI001653EB51|nr:class I SAM-dependent methyltransferase [Hymenobacter sp. BT491]MBC6988347.1 class I SAM-dependent methyltransferase [Hymenobacter sp. BT491]